MSFTIEYKKSAKYLLARVKGDWTKDNALKAFDEIKIEADKHAMKLILVDALGVSFPNNEMTRYFTGEKIAQIYRSYKMAIYLQRQKINKFVENVALNRGATLNVCNCEEDAINWLVS